MHIEGSNIKVEGDAAVMLARAFGAGPKKTRKSKVPCPECEKELVFTEPGIIHNDPPRKRVKCLECGYKGFHAVGDPGPCIDITDQILQQKVTPQEVSHKKQED